VSEWLSSAKLQDAGLNYGSPFWHPTLGVKRAVMV